MSDKEFPERIYVQMYPKLTNKALHLAAYESDPREAHDNGKPVYEYVSADLLAEAKREGEAIGLERAVETLESRAALWSARWTGNIRAEFKSEASFRNEATLALAEDAAGAISALSPDPSYIGRIKAERDALGRGIAGAATAAGIIDGKQPLTGPELLLLCDDLGKQSERIKAEVWKAALVAARTAFDQQPGDSQSYHDNAMVNAAAMERRVVFALEAARDADVGRPQDQKLG